VRAFGWRSTLQPAFVAASVAWAALLLLAPLVASRPRPSDGAAVLVLAVYGIGSLLCHQLPARSYRVWSAQMPVCARCVGIYFGAAIAAVASVGARRVPPSLKLRRTAGALAEAGQPIAGPSPACAPSRSRGERLARRWQSLREPRVALIVAVAPTLATLVYEWTTGDVPAHWIRTAAGVPIGAVAAWFVVRETSFRRS
jgi:hypothetical protein